MFRVLLVGSGPLIIHIYCPTFIILFFKGYLFNLCIQRGARTHDQESHALPTESARCLCPSLKKIVSHHLPLISHLKSLQLKQGLRTQTFLLRYSPSR